MKVYDQENKQVLFYIQGVLFGVVSLAKTKAKDRSGLFLDSLRLYRHEGQVTEDLAMYQLEFQGKHVQAKFSLIQRQLTRICN